MLRLILSVAFLLIASSIPSLGDLPPDIMDAPPSSPGSLWNQDNVFTLNSKPGATRTIYLDFDGHTTINTSWNGRSWNGGDKRDTITIETPRFSVDPDPDTNDYSPEDYNAIGKIWAQVAEDFAPFDVNVTTAAPPGNNIENGIRVCIGGSGTDWYNNNVGGVAAIGSFEPGADAPAFVFPEGLGGNPKSIAEAVSHEVGHTLGINYHYGLGDGSVNDLDKRDDPNTAYYYGDTEGEWAPIMGAGYRNDVTQWSNGDYENASRGNSNRPPYTSIPEGGDEEGDLETITTKIDYREDDNPGGDKESDYYIDGTKATIADLFDTESEMSKFIKTGIIERDSDADVFKFTLNKGDNLTFEVLSGIWKVGEELVSTAANLNILLKLFDSEWNPLMLNGIDNFISGIGFDEISLSTLLGLDDLAGTYYLWLEGTGREDYYSSYGSLGTYAVEGTVHRAPANPQTPTPTTPEPNTLMVLWLGLLGLALVKRRRK